MPPPSSHEPLRLSADDLFAPSVDAFLDEQAMASRAMPEVEPQPWILRFLYSSYFYLSLAGGLGAMVAWMLIEPFISESEHSSLWALLLLFPAVAAMSGLFIGAAEGIMCRNIERALICGSVSLAVGLLGGALALIPTGIVYTIMRSISSSVSGHSDIRLPPVGVGWAFQIMGRGAAWAVAAIPAGLGQGLALREPKIIANGLLGAVLGGLAGGMLFDPIYLVFSNDDGEGWLSRGVGLTTIGLFVGLLVGIVEQWTKSAWLLMKAGPLAGKQFVVFRNPTVLGSSPKADIYLFKDEAIEPRHALIHDRGGRYEIEDLNSADGTYVNGIPVHRQILRAGDQIVLGKTVLVFDLKESR